MITRNVTGQIGIHMSHRFGLHFSILRNIGPRLVCNSRFYSGRSPFPINHKEHQEKKRQEELPKWRQWANYVKTNEFKRSMTVYYLCGFGVMLVTFYYYMRDRYYEDKQMRHIRQKYQDDPSSLSEYEYLKLKAFSSDKLKPSEDKKFKLYQMMRKEFRRKNILNIDVMFEPTPQDLEDWYSKQAKRVVKKAPVGEDSGASEDKSAVSNSENPYIMAPEETTAFFDKKAAEYDDEIKWEERGMFLGRRRKWLMQQLKGDVLEVACGTGRNLPYLNPDGIDSITFLDSSENMVKITQKKFREKYPKYDKAAFTVGKAEDLVDLANSKVKYDTIVEAFGLCAHEDPVKALESMSQLLKPGGRIVLLEHGRSTYDFINNHLDFRSEKRMKTWACRWNLDIGELIDEAGLDITYEKRVHLGTTWLLICKRPQDPINVDEKPFYNKLFGKDVEVIKRN
ncbi:uncharacterized protein PRCAT00000499001 [Priceomyces carsonii]|uniref:uncharacterized protein n=1 Tax=Priceomyces carsonii TaxID=28549 RepID=UPI002EDB26BE|nr:unnamed protein product [Priceomyces carsonii]